MGYLVIFIIYIVSHLTYLIEYPAFSTDEMFYVAKAVCWEKNGTPCTYGSRGLVWPEFTNPSTLPWLLIIIFGIFGASPVVLRSFIFFVGVLNLLFVFLIGQELGKGEKSWRGFGIGIIGGLILAIDQELVFFSRIGYLDNLMNLFLTIFLYFYLKHLRTNDLKFAWLAGLSGGISLWFKLSAFFILIGLGIFVLIARKIDGPLRVQAIMTLFAGIYLQWGLTIDPMAFASGTVFQMTKEYDANPIDFWWNLVFHYGNTDSIDEIRMMILFCVFIPIFYFKGRQEFIYKGSFFIFCIFCGILLFFSFLTRSLYDYYLAGFASIYAILFAISIILASDGAKYLYYKFLQHSISSPYYKNRLKQEIRLGIAVFFIFIFILQFSHFLSLAKSRYPLEYLTSENQENLEIISYIEENIPKGATLVAPIEIGPWLNMSGYSVWNTWLGGSTPEGTVLEYIQLYLPTYSIMHRDYLHILEGLNYFTIKLFTNYELLKLAIT